MSYEGYREFLCTRGHYGRVDAHDDTPSKCPICESPIEIEHSVDETNGFEENNPGTWPMKKRVIGYEDEWHLDRHGNKYARTIELYALDRNG